MSPKLLRIKKSLTVLALGGSLLVITTGFTPSCDKVVGINILEGLGSGVIASGADAFFGAVGGDFQRFGQTPVTQGLQSGWDSFLTIQFPVRAVQQELFVP